MSAVIGALRAELSASIAEFQDDLGKAAKSVKGFVNDCNAAADGLEKVGERMSLAITAPLVLIGTESVKAAASARAALAQVEAALDSTGGQSGKTAEQLTKSAEALASISTFDNTEILSKVTESMLRFGNVTGDTFDRAQKASVNLAARMGIDLADAASTVGKALNQPITGLRSLQQIGIRFTQDQQKQILALTSSGKGYQAQAMILKELEDRFNGAAQAARDASPQAAAMQRWRDLQVTIGQIVQDDLTPLIEKLDDLLKKFQQLDPVVQKQTVEFLAIAAAAGPLIVVLGNAVRVVGALAKPFAELGAMLGDLFTGDAMAGILASIGELAADLSGIGAIVVALVALMAPYWKTIQDAIVGVYDTAKTYLGDAFSDLFQALIGLWQQFATILVDLWNGPIGKVLRALGEILADVTAAFVGVFGTIIVGLITAFVEVLAGAVAAIIDSLAAVVKFLDGDFVGAWKSAKKAVEDAAGAIGKTSRDKDRSKNAPAVKLMTGDQYLAAEGIVPPKFTITPNKPGKQSFDLGKSGQGAQDKLDALATSAQKDGIAVSRFANGDLDALDKALEEVDDKYGDLKITIQGHITDLTKLGLGTKEAKTTMATLQGALTDLAAAHDKARAAAIAQYNGEKALADLQAKGQLLSTTNQIRDFAQAAGKAGGPISTHQADMQKAADDLAATQNDAAVALQKSQNDLADAQRKNDADAIARLQPIVDAQQQYYDLVSKTTAEQLTAQEILDKGWKDFTDGLSDSLDQMLSTGQFTFKSLGGLLQKVLYDALKPFTDSVSDTIGGALKGLFAGGFATGGFIPPGQWGITGEQGAEPVFGGRTGVTVVPAQQGSAMGSVYIDARGAVEGTAQQIQAALQAWTPGVVATSVNQAGKNVPGQIARAQKRNF